MATLFSAVIAAVEHIGPDHGMALRLAADLLLDPRTRAGSAEPSGRGRRKDAVAFMDDGFGVLSGATGTAAEEFREKGTWACLPIAYSEVSPGQPQREAPLSDDATALPPDRAPRPDDPVSCPRQPFPSRGPLAARFRPDRVFLAHIRRHDGTLSADSHFSHRRKRKNWSSSWKGPSTPLLSC